MAAYLIGTGNRDWYNPNNWSSTSGGTPADSVGAELITDNACDTPSSWVEVVASGKVSITSGVIRFISVGYIKSTTAIIEIGKAYKLTYEIKDTNLGNLYFLNSNSAAANNKMPSTLGIHTINVSLTTRLDFIIYSGGFVGDIDNVFLQEIYSVPSLTNSAIFDQNSGAGDVTLNANAVCASFNSVGLTQIVRVVSSVYTFSNYGDLTLNGTLSKFAFTGTAYYYQKGTGGITTNGNLFLALNRLYIDGVGITVTNLDDMNAASTSIYHQVGIWNTAGYNITMLHFYPFANGVLNASSSLIILNNIFQQSAICQINSETSTFRFAGNSSSITFTNIITFYNLELTSTSIITVGLILTPNIIVSNNLIITGTNSSNFRYLIASNTIGTPRTITCNGTVTASNVDFRDITLAGTCNKDLSAITGGSGDCGGNSGIIFTTPQPQYFKKYASTANVGDAANWFSDLALTVVGRVPLPQDLGSKFLAGSFDRTCTVTCNVPRIPCLDMSEVVNTVTWSLANSIEVYGSYVLGDSIAQTGNFDITYLGVGDFNAYGNSIYTGRFYKEYLNKSNFIVLNQLFIYGIFDFNDFDSVVGRASFVSTSNILMGNGIFSISGTSAGNKFDCKSSAFNPENSTIKCFPSSGSSDLIIDLGNKTYNKIQFSGSHTGNFDISGNNNIAELIIDSGRKVRFTAGTTKTINKATIGANVTLDCITASTYTLALADITTAENANIKGCIAPVSKLFAEANSVDSGSNTNVVFGDYFTPQEILIENRIN